MKRISRPHKTVNAKGRGWNGDLIREHGEGYLLYGRLVFKEREQLGISCKKQKGPETARRFGKYLSSARVWGAFSRDFGQGNKKDLCMRRLKLRQAGP